MCQGCVSDTDGKNPTRKRKRHTSNLLGLVLVNEESIITVISGIEHLSPGTNDNGTLVFSLLYVCEESKRNKNKNLSMI